MRKFTASFFFFSIIALFLTQFPFAKAYANADEQAADKAFFKAQEIIIKLETGIEEAEELLQEIKERGTENEYQVAEQIKNDAEAMLTKAKKHRSDSSNIAKDLNIAPTDIVATAVTFTSRAEADTSRSYARIGQLFLKVLQFTADNELDCAEKTNEALRDKHKTWRLMKKIVVLADRSLEHASSALSVKETAEDEAEISTRAARECIALTRELNLHLANFEDICNEFEKEWRDYKEFKDMEDDNNPSPV